MTMSEQLRAMGMHAEAANADRLERAVGDLVERIDRVRASLGRDPDLDPA